MRFFRAIHVISLDVVFGALAMQAMLWQVLVGGQQSVSEHVVLGLSVWIFYLADRQLDNVIKQPADAIHVFHQEFRHTIRLLIGFLLTLLVYSLSYVSLELIWLGVWLSLAMGMYGFALRFWDRFWLPKEVFTAILYACGLFLPSFSVGKFSWLLFSEVVLLAFMNLSLFTWLEGKAYFRVIFYRLQWPLLALLCCILWQFPALIAFCFAIIQGIHVWIYYFIPNLQPRWLGELAFLSPILYFIYELF